MSGLEKFYTLNPQFYKNLWLSSKSSSSFLEQVQANRKLNQIDFKYRLQKAVSSWHSHLLFDEIFLENKNLESYIRWTQKSQIHPVILVSVSSLPKYKKRLEELAISFGTQAFDNTPTEKLQQQSSQTEDFNLEFHFICEDKDFSIKELGAFQKIASLVYVITKKNKNSFSKEDFLTGETKNHQNFFKKRYFYFPYKTHFRDSFLTSRQLYRFLEKNLKLPPYPVDIYDKRIPKDMDLAPLYKPFFENPKSQNLAEEIYFSVVIPCYNSEKQLLNTLDFLSQQDFPKNQYEVIVVDDGSPHPIRESLIAFSKKNPSLNIKGIYFPRVIEKMKKSARFRAGLARNLGVKHSRGKYLAFLDSDILVPSHYLTRLKKEHEQADLILVKRYHLNKNSLSLKSGLKSEELFSKVQGELNTDYLQNQRETELKKATIRSKKPSKSKEIDTYIEEESYWGAFYKKGFDKVKYPWKYVCSYGLSLSRKDFNSEGGFGKTFLFYGFEDTDLGYRLLKKNKKILLSDIVVLHQADRDSMTWSYPLFRQAQLLKTAKIFFYRHLDPEIYKALRVYMRQERPLSYFKI